MLDANELRLVSDQLGVIERGDMKTVEYYKCTGWNLQNIALSSVLFVDELEIFIWAHVELTSVCVIILQGSLLQYQTEPITGINSPWLYLGMLFTSFCWHTEVRYRFSNIKPSTS